MFHQVGIGAYRASGFISGQEPIDEDEDFFQVDKDKVEVKEGTLGSLFAILDFRKIVVNHRINYRLG
jgi:hypothetical protein